MTRTINNQLKQPTVARVFMSCCTLRLLRIMHRKIYCFFPIFQGNLINIYTHLNWRYLLVLNLCYCVSLAL